MGPFAESVDAIVLGAGIAGLTAAHDLAQAGHRVSVLESFAHAGGNHRSSQIDDMTFDIGAIFFWSHMPVFDMFPEMRARCVTVPWRTQRISPDGAVRPYPFDIRSELFGRSPGFVARAAASLLKARARGLQRRSADDFLRYYLGDEVRRVSGIDDFIRRFYGRAPGEISFDFARQRMQQIARGTQLATRSADVMRAMRRRLVPAVPDAPIALARPKAGFVAHYAPAVERLEAAGVRFYFDAGEAAIARGPDGFTVQARQGRLHAQRLISTIPIERLADRMGVAIANLPTSLSLTTLCCRFRGDRGFDATVLYNFNRSGRWKRLTMHSDYYGRTGNGAEYFGIETVTDEDRSASPTVLFGDFRTFAESHGIFRGQLELVGTMETPFAYPLYDLGVEQKRAAAIGQLSDRGVELMGRQGQFAYHPTSGNVVLDVRSRLASVGSGHAPVAHSGSGD